MTIKELFEKSDNEALTYEQFTQLMKENKAQFEDVKDGRYVSKNKFDDEIEGREEQIKTLSATISSRDNDLESLKAQLAEAGTDATKLTDLQSQFNNLQSKYDTDTKSYENKLRQQAYEFAVKEFASTKKFSSNAAKRDFIGSMIAKELKMDGDKILGAEDFVTSYSTENEDAFVVEKEKDEEEQLPTFIQPSSDGNNAPQEDNGGFHFNFLGVRPKED